MKHDQETMMRELVEATLRVINKVLPSEGQPPGGLTVMTGRNPGEGEGADTGVVIMHGYSQGMEQLIRMVERLDKTMEANALAGYLRHAYGDAWYQEQIEAMKTAEPPTVTKVPMSDSIH